MAIYGKKEVTKVVAEPTIEKMATPKASVPLLKEMVEQKFISVNLSTEATVTGLKTSAKFTIKNHGSRGTPGKEIQINYCPVTGGSLAEIDAVEFSNGQKPLL